ncbi:MAG TPA: Lrp/AsnC ligand binding domain-containing protein [Nitrososphaeraceae archaeon]|jgi:DNA-binding Lrp family transcriptional regulator|nr:Lrp/AsnC ligand binding domain-containing protein [Nitrososphaeraceae archaeon]
MAEAYVLITCEEGSEEKIINELSEINDIITTNRVIGPYNILVKIKGETIDTVIETITSDIKTIDKIQYTLTLKVKH